MGAGSRIAFRGSHTVAVPAIVLQGNAEITMGSSTAGGTDPVFGHGISGAYRLTLNGKSDCIATLSAANSFAELIATPQYGTAFDINATVAGSLGGNVTILANATNGTTGADLTVSAVNAMSDTALLLSMAPAASLPPSMPTTPSAPSSSTALNNWRVAIPTLPLGSTEAER